MIPILVTGGAGYIGAHTCKALLAHGFLPITYDNLSTGHRYAVKWGPLIEGDLQDTACLEKAFAKYRPVAVLHFAASALVIESMKDPGKYYDNNVKGSLCLLQTMQKQGVSHLVFSSTCATYGNAETDVIAETHPQKPINPYGKSKWMVEQIIEDYAKIHGLSAMNLRYFNAAGADFQGEIGENHTPETHIIPLVLQVAQNVRKEVVIYGNDFPTHDGTAIRDYIHVEDLSIAHVLALQWVLKHKKSDAINLGTGRGVSVLDIVRTAEEVTGIKIPTRIENRREGEPAKLVASNVKATQQLGWTPKRSSLSSIISSAWKWHNALMLQKN